MWALLDAIGIEWGGPCYAGNHHETRMALAMPTLYAPRFTEVRLAPGRMARAAAWSDLTGTERPDKPWLDGMPRVIFVGDMGDIFSKAVPFDYLKTEVIDIAAGKKGSRHIWMLLTKQPQRMLVFAGWLGDQGIRWPDNVWAGTSVTSQPTLSRAFHLLKVPAKIRFLSVEPQLKDVDLDAKELLCAEWPDRLTVGTYLDLIIQGGESDQREHRGRPFDLAWARKLRDQCRASKTAYFLKQVGSTPYDSFYRNGEAVPLSLKDHHGGIWDEWPCDLRVREMPAPRATAPAGGLF